MLEISLAALAKNLSFGAPTQDVLIKGLSRDTRTLVPGNLYVAIQGENYDGHDFVAAAYEKKASAVLVNRLIENCPLPQLIVHDTLEALGKISAFWRNQFSLPLIGVTGSNGKTTLKNMIASILNAACGNDARLFLATEGNLNNNIGVPLMLARLSKEQRYGVIEMGMNHFGEIAYLTELVKPKVAVINNAAAAHLQGLHDVAGVARAKGEIFLGLPTDGIAILNRDDAFFNYWQELIGNHAFITFGLDNPADVTADITDTGTLQMHTPEGDITVNLPLLGKHNVQNALAATAATLAIKIDLNTIKKGLESVKPAPGRLCQHVLPNGVHLIDDTYNANPASALAAIHTLAHFAGQRILVLGDMKELGDNARELHFSVGQKARAAGIQQLFTLGDMSKAATQGFGNGAEHFTDKDALVRALQPYLEQKQTTLLIKGSRSMRMEKVIAGLIPTLHTENAH